MSISNKHFSAQEFPVLDLPVPYEPASIPSYRREKMPTPSSLLSISEFSPGTTTPASPLKGRVSLERTPSTEMGGIQKHSSSGSLERETPFSPVKERDPSPQFSRENTSAITETLLMAEEAPPGKTCCSMILDIFCAAL